VTDPEPSGLWLVRHGESVGNLAADRAETAGAEVIDVDRRDMDVPLSPRGEQQAAALGGWLAGLGGADRPRRLLCSPYTRTRQTAALALRAAGGPLAGLPVSYDERLRDRDFGVLDGLTVPGIRSRYPQEAARRARLGKFYYRPPGGESWCDVALRVRPVLEEVRSRWAGESVLVVTHDVVVLIFRYLAEGLDEEQLLGIGRRTAVGNCSVTRLAPHRGGLRCVDFNLDIGPPSPVDRPAVREPAP
jgi:probable phosphoglycerate mutase